MKRWEINRLRQGTIRSDSTARLFVRRESRVERGSGSTILRDDWRRNVGPIWYRSLQEGICGCRTYLDGELDDFSVKNRDPHERLRTMQEIPRSLESTINAARSHLLTARIGKGLPEKNCCDLQRALATSGK